MRYWLLKPILNGFETAMLMFGTESALVEYVKGRINLPVSYSAIDYDTVSHLENLGLKVYCLPAEPVNMEATDDTVSGTTGE
jgi:hypothetical protein